MSKRYTDRYGRDLHVGDRVRVQHCIGRYGQVEVVEGVIDQISIYSGVTLRLDDDTQKYVTIDPTGYRKFEDFEHGHETWTEIVVV